MKGNNIKEAKKLLQQSLSNPGSSTQTYKGHRDDPVITEAINKAQCLKVYPCLGSISLLSSLSDLA